MTVISVTKVSRSGNTALSCVKVPDDFEEFVGAVQGLIATTDSSVTMKSKMMFRNYKVRSFTLILSTLSPYFC